MFLKFVFKTKTNEVKSTELLPLLLLKPTYICSLLRAKKGQQKVQNLKKTTRLCPSTLYSRCYYSMPSSPRGKLKVWVKTVGVSLKTGIFLWKPGFFFENFKNYFFLWKLGYFAKMWSLLDFHIKTLTSYLHKLPVGFSPRFLRNPKFSKIVRILHHGIRKEIFLQLFLHIQDTRMYAHCTSGK